MEQYYFLYSLAFLWLVIAVKQDLKRREIWNWLNFSLIVIALAYRGFYSLISGDVGFFMFGFGGVVLFSAVSYLLYYGSAFGGGDAKLLMGLGAVLPFESVYDYLVVGFGYIFLVFGVGIVYSLLYTLFLINRNREKFLKEFKKDVSKYKAYLAGALAFSFVMLWLFYSMFSAWYALILFLAIAIMPLLLIYARVIERCCMIKLVDAKSLTEGDWITEDIKLGRNVIKKSVHGLSLEDIKILRKFKKKIMIKDGVPFSPSFLIALAIMVFVVLA